MLRITSLVEAKEKYEPYRFNAEEYKENIPKRSRETGKVIDEFEI
jgi:hypothetical protein